jgi:hypothetical protein
VPVNNTYPQRLNKEEISTRTNSGGDIDYFNESPPPLRYGLTGFASPQRASFNQWNAVIAPGAAAPGTANQSVAPVEKRKRFAEVVHL